MTRASALGFGILAMAALVLCSPANADGLVYQFEGDVLPFPDAGFFWGGCEPPCHETIDDGRFVLTWLSGVDDVNYTHLIADSEPLTSLWIEWRFRSDEPFSGLSALCDAAFVAHYRKVHDLVFMFGDAVISFSGDFARTGLALNVLHTYRFESLNGADYCFFVDGKRFYCHTDRKLEGGSYLQFYGHGGCGTIPHDVTNEWDHIRYGTIGFGEKMIASDPPSGFVDLRHQAAPDRFAITYDQPNYAYLEDITVEVTGVGTKPVVTKTWRRDQDGPESLEVVLDRPIPANATTRFILNDGEIINTVRYTTKLGDVDGDGDTDLFEVAAFQNCFNRPTSDPACGALDLSDNALIDLPDLPQLLDPLLTDPK